MGNRRRGPVLVRMLARDSSQLRPKVNPGPLHTPLPHADWTSAARSGAGGHSSQRRSDLSKAPLEGAKVVWSLADPGW